MDAAHDLVHEGRLPDSGTTTTLRAYSPPGAAWLVAPGVAAFSDMRLYEFPGSLALYVGTLVGIFLLGRVALGTTAGCLAVGFYGFSQTALFLASTVWPRAHPFFYVWMAYWTYLWATRRRGSYLLAAVATWSIGMYVFMELAPAIFMVPAVWCVNRGPVPWRGLVLVGVAALALWFPYLRFEAGRDFADVRAQLFLQPLQPIEKYGWCDPSFAAAPALVAPSVADVAPAPEFFSQRAMEWWTRGVSVSTANFHGLVANTDLALLGATIVGAVVLWRRRRPFTEGSGGSDATSETESSWSSAAPGWALLLMATLLNEWSVASFLSWDGALERPTIWAIRCVQSAMVLGGLAVLNRRAVRRMVRRHGLRLEWVDADRRPLVLALVVPWALLLVLGEAGLEYRFLGLAPLQVLVLAGLCAGVRSRSRMADYGRWAAAAPILGFLALNPFVTNRLSAWQNTGWSGVDSPAIVMADHLAGVLRAEGRQQASIGYRSVPTAFSDVAYPGADRRAKVGGVFDAVLQYREGIVNTDGCVEGISPANEYRLIQIPPAPSSIEEAGARELTRVDDLVLYELAPRDRLR